MAKIIDLQESLLKIDEDKTSEVDGVNILGKFSGQFFVPNGKSRNNRFYSKGLWDKTLAKKDLQERLEHRRMFGTISHEQQLDDTALLEGKISHVVTKLYISPEGKGIGEALILNTPAGRILNSLFRAGCKLFVSSRADGEFDEDTHEGMPRVSEDTYQLYSFDVVIEPGFLEANPNIVEKLNTIEEISKDKDIKENKENKGVYTMDEKLFENLLKEKVKLEVDLEKALDERKKVMAEIERLQSSSVSATSESVAIKEELERIKKEHEESKANVEKLTKELEESKKTVAAFEKIGNVKDIDRGISKAVTRIKEYQEIGTVKEMNKAVDMLEAYTKLGTVAEIKKVMESSNKLVTKILKEEEEKAIETVSVELEVPAEVVQKFVDKGIELEDVKELIGDVLKDSEVEVSSEEELKDEDELEFEDEDDISALDKYESPESEEEEEEVEEFPMESKKESADSRLSSLMESFTGRIKNQK